MVAAELFEQFVSDRKIFKHKIKVMVLSDIRTCEDQESTLFQNDFPDFYIKNFLNQIDSIYHNEKNDLQLDLEFYKDDKSKSIFFFNRIEALKKQFYSNKFSYLLSFDHFYEEIFVVEKVDEIFYLFLENDEIIKFYAEVQESAIQHEAIYLILKNQFAELRKLFSILMSLKLIHIEQEKIQKESVVETSKTQEKDNSKLSLNQKILLVDKIISTNNWSNLTQKRQAELIFLITNQNKDNIIKGLRKLYKKQSEKSNREKEDFEYIESITKDLD